MFHKAHRWMLPRRQRADLNDGAEQNNDGAQDNVSEDNRSVFQFTPESNIWWDAPPWPSPNASSDHGRTTVTTPAGTTPTPATSATKSTTPTATTSSVQRLRLALTAGWDCDELKLINVGPNETYNIPGLMTATFAGDDVVAVSGNPTGACTLSHLRPRATAPRPRFHGVLRDLSELVGDTERVLLVASGKLWHLAGEQTTAIADDVRTANVDRNTGNLLVVSQSTPNQAAPSTQRRHHVGDHTTGPVDLSKHWATVAVG